MVVARAATNLVTTDILDLTPVCVSRPDNSTWAITSSPCIDETTGTPETSDMAGLFQENLKGKINHRFKANYAVPFQITVTCTDLGTCL